ncbi:VOC family protein [Arcanobacterium phocae]|uniref:VOC family protein n=1 Tax=Arcanobacterium phocae TaxID=131112 RepID=UPI001C0EEEAE|nr:VOC family protein [Arcanobacterium phocae]
MKLLVINYVGDVEANVRFYQALGLDLEQEVDLVWTETKASGGVLAIHSKEVANYPKQGFEVCMISEFPLEEVQAKLVAAGFDGGTIQEEDFGRLLRVVDPEGNELQINDQ